MGELGAGRAGRRGRPGRLTFSGFRVNPRGGQPPSEGGGCRHRLRFPATREPRGPVLLPPPSEGPSSVRAEGAAEQKLKPAARAPLPAPAPGGPRSEPPGGLGKTSARPPRRGLLFVL